MTLPRQCLSHLHAHGPTNTRDLAKMAGVKTSRVTTAMNRLCRSGFVRRVRREVVGEGKQAANVCVWRALRPLSELRSGPPPATTATRRCYGPRSRPTLGRGPRLDGNARTGARCDDGAQTEAQQASSTKHGAGP